ncbi:NADH-quinone oxidoreductase subunit A [Micromonospora globbae]|uniref:NADH-quinone oxidoreductase subunit A n=1 Tax=Micromonospora globbae TaxID=1894969 RepID=UPI0037B0BA9E
MYAGAVGMALVAALIVAGLYLAHRAAAVASTPLSSLPFQSGWAPEQHALSRYHVRWYLATLLFLAFDVEMLFMYPWAVVVAQLGITAIVEMFIFLAGVFIAVLWAWREGALRWV